MRKNLSRVMIFLLFFAGAPSLYSAPQDSWLFKGKLHEGWRVSPFRGSIMKKVSIEIAGRKSQVLKLAFPEDSKSYSGGGIYSPNLSSLINLDNLMAKGRVVLKLGINISRPEVAAKIALSLVDKKGRVEKVPLINYLGEGYQAQRWTEVNIPLRDFLTFKGERLGLLKDLSFQVLGKPNPGYILFSKVGFVEEGTAPTHPWFEVLDDFAQGKIWPHWQKGEGEFKAEIVQGEVKSGNYSLALRMKGRGSFNLSVDGKKWEKKKVDRIRFWIKRGPVGRGKVVWFFLRGQNSRKYATAFELPQKWRRVEIKFKKLNGGNKPLDLQGIVGLGFSVWPGDVSFYINQLEIGGTK